jgi:hypothetical protein
MQTMQTNVVHVELREENPKSQDQPVKKTSSNFFAGLHERARYPSRLPFPKLPAITADLHDCTPMYKTRLD